MDYAHESEVFRREQTAAQRITDARLTIDPGFVHHRKIETLVEERGAALINAQMAMIPSAVPEYRRKVQIDHIYSRLLVEVCALNAVPPLTTLLSRGKGRLFSSVETTLPAPEVYEQPRVRMRLAPKGDLPYVVELEFSASHIVADTTRSEIATGSEMAIIALYRARQGNTLTFEPLLMGGPLLQPADPTVLPEDSAMFLGFAYGEIFPEDVDEFRRMLDVPPPTSFEPMREISERAFKTCVAEILGQTAPQDWGGEQSDLFSAHVHIAGERLTAAFLFKGPASFRPMGLNHLGKNNDQIVRLAHEPARLLVVQHCHEINQPVRETLRAFAIQPGPLTRRYCLMDGKDSLRLLIGHDMLGRAQELSV